MGYTRLELEQAKVATNAIQLFEALEAHRRDARQVAGSMHWKRIAGREYLYRGYSFGKNRSLGPRSAETESIKASFAARKAAYQARESALKQQLKTHAAYVRANGLNRFPLTAARVIRALQRKDVPFRIIGTNALYAYEARAGVRIEPEHLATSDVDVLMDARQGVRIAAQVNPEGLLALIQRTDKTFQRFADSTFMFCAVNDAGYRVDFITQGGGDTLQMNDFERLLEGQDLTPVTIASLKWLIASPRFAAVVFDERGMPLRLSTVDPRAFVLHKWYVSQRADREPLKRYRDEAQARLVAGLLHLEMRDLPTTRAVARAFPHLLHQGASAELDDFDV
ncbi:GSU2403 family nucleotidyltransferase fold protein [uncultured Halomonas sp.]|uniref:GSU2403 family nucleotidyltransferase fold protein n=1 Tax=uncultured Halomonas sp. TaxID=173971 RepID=UPI00262CA079|nr:GSU2403 family nucleotidyltransferase fold protein [uncultured Halomonas sp.]